jgi:amino acid transporter
MVLGFATPSNLATTIAPSTSLLVGLGTALAGVWWAYDGWANLGPVAEEVRDPNRNVPRALFLGVGAVVLLYCMATTAYHLVLPMDAVAKSQAVLADVFAALFGPVGLYIGAAGVALSTFGAASANLIIGPRIVFAMARDGLLPGVLGRIHRAAKSPANAVIVQALWAMAMVHAAFTIAKPNADGVRDVRSAFDKLTDFAIFGSSIFYALTVAAVYVLRRKLPDAPRPYRTWGYPITPALFLIAFVALQISLFVKDPWQCLSGFILIGAGAVYYLWAVRRPAARSAAS